jgi:HK97 family phage portal protein
MSTPRRIAGTRTRTASSTQERATYARFGANDPMVNSPNGYPSSFPPITWLGGGGDGPTDWWFGIDSGGLKVPIGPHGPWTGGYGPGQSVITRATSLIVGPLSASPYRVVSDSTVGTPQPTPSWVRDPMLLRPDARIVDAVYPAVLRLSRSAFWSGFVRNALHYGLGAFISIPDDTGAPLAGSLRLIDPRFLATVRDEQGALCWTIDDGQGNPAIFDRGGFLDFGAVRYQITVMRNPLTGVDIEGMSLGVFASHPDVFQLGGQISSYMSGTFRSGVPSGYLKTDQPILTQEQADELKGKWLSNHGGDRRSIAVLNATTSFQALAFSPLDAAIGESTRLSIAGTAFAFGLDPNTLGAGLQNSAMYNTLLETWKNHRDFALSPWIVALQDTLSALLPGTNGIVVVLDSFANPPLSERVATGAAAVAAGLMTVDEWRALEGLGPMPVAEEPPALPEPVVEPVVEPVPTGTDGASVRRLSWRS